MVEAGKAREPKCEIGEIAACRILGLRGSLAVSAERGSAAGSASALTLSLPDLVGDLLLQC